MAPSLSFILVIILGLWTISASAVALDLDNFRNALQVTTGVC